MNEPVHEAVQMTQGTQSRFVIKLDEILQEKQNEPENFHCATPYVSTKRKEQVFPLENRVRKYQNN